MSLSDFTDSKNLPAKKDLNLWNKSCKLLSSSFSNLNPKSEEQRRDFMKLKSAINNSTLSLHIAAYENSIEDNANLNGTKSDDLKSEREKTTLIKKWNISKQSWIDSLSFIQNPFEFPRQQEEHRNHPEVMQFKASQKLRNPNKENLIFDKFDKRLNPNFKKSIKCKEQINIYKMDDNYSSAESEDYVSAASEDDEEYVQVSSSNLIPNDFLKFEPSSKVGPSSSSKVEPSSASKVQPPSSSSKVQLPSSSPKVEPPSSSSKVEKSLSKALGNVKITGVKEGNKFKYDPSDVVFGYCEKEIQLFCGDNDGDIMFEDFVKAENGYIPKYNFNILDSKLINNLNELGLRNMRPTQIAAFQATFFDNAANLSSQPSDFLGNSSTGSGKTHAFLVPIVQKCLNRLRETTSSNAKRTPMALIFAHSTALVDGIYQRALEVVRGTDIKVQIIAGGYPHIQDGYFDIGVCSIGRFKTHFDQNYDGLQLDLNDLKYLVIDEADKMIEFEDFYPLFIKMKEKATFATMLFSATSSISVMDYLNTNNYYQFIFGEANTVAISIKQRFWQVNSRAITKIVGAATGNIRILEYVPDEIAHPFDVLYHFIKRTNEGEKKKRFVVFVKRTCVADFIAQKLVIYGIKAVSVYSESSKKFNRDAIEKRNRLLGQFIDGKVHVLVATQLLTRGTDMEVDYVINYDLPLNYFDFVHRCGRTGRNQQSGTAVTFVDLNNEDDYSRRVLRQIVLNFKQDLPKFLLEFAENAKISKEAEMEIRQNVAKNREINFN